MHSSIHVIVENQLAMGVELIPGTIAFVFQQIEPTFLPLSEVLVLSRSRV